ncbi:hypothetical protein BYT27DRAFT_7272452, partial [Phlegmacium glaucopus]
TVSSECVFSSASITLSKCRNQLQGDIVEALQFLKCAFCCDLIFHEVYAVKEEETLLDHDGGAGTASKDDGVSWEELFIESSDISESDIEV